MTDNQDLLARLKQEFIATKAPAVAPAAPDPQATDFTTLDDYRMVTEMQRVYGEGGLRNPYFLARSGSLTGTVTVADQPLLTFSGYNYLGLSQDLRVVAAAQQALQTYGTHAGAARMVGGETQLHGQLERALADFAGLPDCVVTVGGYATNLAVIGYLLGRRDLLIHDEYIHNSGLMGGILSGARRISFPHNDLEALEARLKENRSQYQRAMILIEGAYSMDGDLPDLARIVELKRRYNCWLMVDEAHSYGTLGATGRGLCEHLGLEPGVVDISMGTLSKSFASCGGFIAGSRELIALLRHFAPGVLLYSTGLSPANAGAALAALEVLQAEPRRVARLQANTRRFIELARQRHLDVGTAGGEVPIVPVMVGDSMKAVGLMSQLLSEGIIVHAVIYPVVPQNQARLRFFITAEHDESQMIRVLDRVAAILTAAGGGQ